MQIAGLLLRGEPYLNLDYSRSRLCVIDIAKDILIYADCERAAYVSSWYWLGPF